MEGAFPQRSISVKTVSQTRFHKITATTRCKRLYFFPTMKLRFQNAIVIAYARLLGNTVGTVVISPPSRDFRGFVWRFLSKYFERKKKSCRFVFDYPLIGKRFYGEFYGSVRGCLCITIKAQWKHLLIVNAKKSVVPRFRL